MSSGVFGFWVFDTPGFGRVIFVHSISIAFDVF